MKSKLIGFGVAVVLMSLVNIFGPEETNDCEHEIIYGISQGYSSGLTMCAVCGKVFEACPWEPIPEPNEPKCEHKNISASNEACVAYHEDGSICFVCPDCGEYVNTKDMQIWTISPEPWEPAPEPNNPLDFIPTWPKYIELENDLVITHQYETTTFGAYNPQTDLFDIETVMADWVQEYPKGTKIYFKEEE